MIMNKWCVGLLTAVALVLAGCSRAPTEAATEVAKSAAEAAAVSIVPKDASRQAEKIVATIDPRPECEPFRAQIRDAGKGSPAAGKTQMAFSVARQAARDAGCVKDR